MQGANPGKLNQCAPSRLIMTLKAWNPCFRSYAGGLPSCLSQGMALIAVRGRVEKKAGAPFLQGKTTMFEAFSLEKRVGRN